MSPTTHRQQGDRPPGPHRRRPRPAGRPGPSPPRQLAKAAVDRLIRLGLPRFVPRIIRVLSHDRQAFTQGLAYHDGALYESTGGYGSSSVRRLDPSNGHVRDLIPVPGDFAEGIAAVGDRLLQLSWRSGEARIYNLPSLEKIGTLAYEGEGWGLASGPSGPIMSDGSCTLRFCNDRLGVARTLRVTSRGLPIRKINDLEWAGGRLYANVWFSGDLLEISPQTGRVIGVVDCSALVSLAGQDATESVLNGIAHDPDRGTFYLTGKHWPSLFEVAIARIG